jgi:hypothetical protein
MIFLAQAAPDTSVDGFQALLNLFAFVMAAMWLIFPWFVYFRLGRIATASEKSIELLTKILKQPSDAEGTGDIDEVRLMS